MIEITKLIQDARVENSYMTTELNITTLIIKIEQAEIDTYAEDMYMILNDSNCDYSYSDDTLQIWLNT